MTAIVITALMVSPIAVFLLGIFVDERHARDYPIRLVKAKTKLLEAQNASKGNESDE